MTEPHVGMPVWVFDENHRIYDKSRGFGGGHMKNHYSGKRSTFWHSCAIGVVMAIIRLVFLMVTFPAILVGYVIGIAFEMGAAGFLIARDHITKLSESL